MRVLAIDPGYARCGIAVLESAGAENILLYSNCIETSADQDFPSRLNTVVQECTRVLQKHQPDHLALEKLFFSTNRKTAMKVAEVRGALLGLAGATALQVFEYSPGEVKSATAGYGGADKHAIASMVRALVKMDAAVRLDDEYDAIAIGVTHLATYRPSLRDVKKVQ